MENTKERITEIIGEASMLWTEIPTGVFKTERALELVDEIMTHIEYPTIEPTMSEDKYLKGIRDALLAVRKAKVGILGTPSSADTQTIINIVTDTIARMYKVSLEAPPLNSSGDK